MEPQYSDCLAPGQYDAFAPLIDGERALVEWLGLGVAAPPNGIRELSKEPIVEVEAFIAYNGDFPAIKIGKRFAE
jgi:hypothetical protein